MLRIALRGFAIFAVATGATDVTLGGTLLAASGANLAIGASADPLVDSQLRFFGAVWAGYGALLWWAAERPWERRRPLFILAITMVLAGIGRAASASIYGVASPAIPVFIALELGGPLALFAWMSGKRRRRQPEGNP